MNKLNLLKIAKEIGKRASKIANNFIEKKDIQIIKNDNINPTFNIDILIEEFIYKELTKTGIQVISEEKYCKEKINDVFWLIDPIDGSKGLINNDYLTINIALIENGFPVFGVLEDLKNNKQYFGFGTNHNYLKDWHNLLKVDNTKLKLVISKLHDNPDDELFIANNGIKKVEKMNSSMKFIALVNNESDIYLRNEGSSAWDTAAGQAILESSGGLVINLSDFKRLRYYQNLRNNPFISIKKDLYLKSIDRSSALIDIYEINNSGSR